MKIAALLLLAFAPLLSAQTEQEAWDKADALKKRAAYADAAAAWEAFPTAFPQSPRAAQALVEAGVCWFSAGRAAQQLHRNTPQSRVSFDRGLALFDRVVKEHPKEPIASRARHMRGSTHLFSGELEQAETAYTSVLEEFAFDRSYVDKALEYRAMTRRHLLKNELAIADMERWLKDFATPAKLETMKSELSIARLLDKPAPPYKPERWISGQPSPIELLGGQVVALYFWATWCPNCAKEEPFILDLERRYAPQGLVLIGVTDHQKNQTPDVILKHVTERKYGFPVYQDNGGSAVAYKALAIPHLVLIDRHGKVRWADNPAELSDWTVERLLTEDDAAGK